jgi:hypothetical protein
MEKTKYRGHEIEIKQDENAESPREWDNLGTMVCFHRRYLGDEHTFTVEEVKDILDRKDVIALPLYLYDHSGITMSCKPFSCPWDSGQVGIIFADYEKIRKEFSVTRVGAKLREKVRKILISEVETYDTYLRGEVYGYVTDYDSCWGYYSEKEALDEAKGVIDRHIKKAITEHLAEVKAWIKNKVGLQYRKPLGV